MKQKAGREMRRLVVAISVGTLLLVLAVIAYFMVDVILTTNKNIDRNKELVVEQSVFTLTEIGDNINGMTGDTRMIGLFNRDLMDQILAGNWDVFYDFIGDFAISFYPIEYIGVIRNGELAASRSARGFDVSAGNIPDLPASGSYKTLTKLGDKEGFFVSVLYPIKLSVVGLEDFGVNMIVDRTAQMAFVEDYFKQQRDDLIVRLSIASAIAIIISLLFTTIGLRHFTRKYVVKPIEDINRAAEEIMAGTYDGEVQVEEDSAFAALQGLLRSGQKVLQRLDQEMRE
ncbi:MAG: hypothetical protein HPY75_07490 [Actinobacteria bacterium]|nr:hypothetical protein [Actinomycetota bacterium]